MDVYAVQRTDSECPSLLAIVEGMFEGEGVSAANVRFARTCLSLKCHLGVAVLSLADQDDARGASWSLLASDSA